MAKKYILRLRGGGVDLTTVRIYYKDYAYGIPSSETVELTKADPHIDTLWADYEKSLHKDIDIDLLSLNVFTSTTSSYRIGASFLDDVGNESNIVNLPIAVRFDNVAPADPSFMELIIENV